MKTLSDARAIELFDELRSLEANSRSARLNSETKDDPDLRAELLALLSAHDRNSAFLDQPALGKDFRLLDCLDSENNQPEIPPLPVGTLVGPYSILKLLSRGEDASVYLAQQDHPVRRLAAVKILNSQLRRREVLKRFELERQSIAAMQHQNIAILYDAGTTESGRAYFAMEYVEGRPITDACREDALPISERLRIFIQVCRAVEHAHQRGLIHRDLKPGNILVTKGDDGRPLAKLIDFGVAKAVSSRPEHSVTVVANQLIGTVAYMSPEQLTGSARLIDTRADVFALGRVLYELIAGRPPFDLSGLESNAAIHKLLHETPPRLRESGSEFRGDLETITETATAFEPARRYQSVSELRADVERFLEARPIEARKPGALYKFRKFLFRHKVSAVISAAAIAFACFGGISAWRANNNRLELAMQLAEAWFDETLYMERTIGEYGKRAPIVERLAAHVERFVAIAPDDSRVQTILAAVLEEQGSGAQELAHIEQAERYFARALEIRGALLRQAPADDQRAMNFSIALVHLGDIAGERNDWVANRDFYLRALEIDEDVIKRRPRDTHALSNLAWSYERVGIRALAEGRNEDALTLFNKELKTFETFGSISPCAEVHRGLAGCYNCLETVGERLGQSSADLERFRNLALDQARLAAELAPKDRHALRTFVITQSNYYCKLSQQLPVEAKAILPRLIEVAASADELLHLDPGDKSIANAVCWILIKATELARQIPDLDSAHALNQKAIDRAADLCTRIPSDKSARETLERCELDQRQISILRNVRPASAAPPP